LRAGRGQRSASLHIVIPVIVAPHMSLMRGVSPTLVRIEHSQRYAHSDPANGNCGVATSARRMSSSASITSHDKRCNLPRTYVEADHPVGETPGAARFASDLQGSRCADFALPLRRC